MSTDNSTDRSDLIGESLAGSAANDDMQFDDIRPRSPAEALEPARAPEPPERRGRRKTHPVLVMLNGLMTLLVVSLIILGAVLYFAKAQFDRPGPLTASTVVAIPQGDGVNAIATRLEREGIISDRRIFVASVIYFKAQNKLKAGEFEVRKGASMRDVLDMLVRGKSILYTVTIPEGLTSHEAVERLGEAELLTGDVAEIPPEGSLMPDTYKFSRGMSRQEMVERMQAEQRKFIANLWETRAPDLPVKNMEEAITLASIVEKETSRADERARVAGVFINRLRRGMRLQSDPTIIYGVTEGKGSLGRPILRSEIDRKTPYNTYQIDGLPPGPIANPSRASIQAVLNPAETDALFFVADGSGGHAFAKSLDEHNRNVARWREIEREMRERERELAEEKRMAEEAAKLAAQSASDGQGGAGDAASGTAGENSGASITTGVPGLSIGGSLDLPHLDLSQAANPAAAEQDAPADAGAPPEAQSGSAVPLPLRKPSAR